MKKSSITKLLACAIGLLAGQSAHATSLDLTTSGSSGFLNGGFFQQIPDQSTGTGVIDPFVRIQKNDTEEGFNTSVNKVALDNKGAGDGTFIKDIQLSIVPMVNRGGTDYYQFLLDLNESAGGRNELISLFELEIWLKPTAITSFAGATGVYTDLSNSGAVKKWDLDVGVDGDSVIELDYSLNAGSGSGDMFAYIPKSALGTDGSQFLYLYSKFGTPNNTDAGFEEWATLRAPTTTNVPDGGATVALLGISLLGMMGARKAFDKIKA